MDQTVPQNRNLKTGIGPTVDKLLNGFLDTITDDNGLMEPIMNIISKKIEPYVYLTFGFYIIVIFLLLIIIYLLIQKKSK